MKIHDDMIFQKHNLPLEMKKARYLTAMIGQANF